MPKKKSFVDEVPEEFKNPLVEDKVKVESTVAQDVTPKKEVVKNETDIPEGFILCKVAAGLKMNRGGVLYEFKAPNFTCALPEALAKYYDGNKHVISIA